MDINDSISKKILLTVILLLLVSLLFGINIYAQVQTTTDEMGVKIEKISESKWNIINRDGEFVGKLESESLRTFKMYYTNGMFVGIILESGAWQPRLYRSRQTTVLPDEARLYLDALDAIKLIK